LRERDFVNFKRCIIPILIAVTSIWSIGASLASSPQIQFSASACFFDMAPKGQTAFPIVINLKNTGRSTHVLVKVQAQQSNRLSNRSYLYPIDMPTGSEKKFVAFPFHGDYGYSSGFDVILSGDNIKTQDIPVRTNSNYFDNFKQIGLISTLIGSMNIIKYKPNPSVSICYSIPEDAPDRSIGLRSLDEIVIGEGAEKLSDAQWNAIREWVQEGGDLVLLGGAGSRAYLDSPIARHLSPVEQLTETTGNAASAMPGFSGSGTTAIVTGSLKLGAVKDLSLPGNAPLTSHWRYGLGRVRLIGFNPLIRDFRAGDQAGTYLSALFETQSLYKPLNWEEDTNWNNEESQQSAKKNPFNIQLPNRFIVGAIFFIYFLLVIPVTFIVLRQKKRLEAAWITTPIISLAFVLILFCYTMELYSAKTSHRTRGLLTVAYGESDATFQGLSEMFFQFAGSYEINIQGAQSLERESENNNLNNSSQEALLETLDTELGVLAPSYNVSNLSFQRFYFTRSINIGGAITANLAKKDNGMIEGTITNSSMIPLSNVSIKRADNNMTNSTNYDYGNQNIVKTFTHSYNQICQVDDIAPGATANVSFSADSGGFENGLYLSARIDADKLGSQTGNNVSGKNTVTFIENIPISTGAGK
jgi:hypothetical protein